MNDDAPLPEASLRALVTALAELRHAPDAARAAAHCVEVLVGALGAARAVVLLPADGGALGPAAVGGFDGDAPAFSPDDVDAWLDDTLGAGCPRITLSAPAGGLLAAAPASGAPGLQHALSLLAVALAGVLETQARGRAVGANGAGRGTAADLRLALRGLSHDVRSPLQAVMMQHSLLASGSLGALNPEQQQALQAMRDGLGGIRDMARAAWEVGRVLGGDIDLAPDVLCLDELLDDVSAAARHELAPRGHRLECTATSGLEVVADAAATSRILFALLDNAAKFAPAPAHIELAARACDDGRVAVSVTDDGPGVPEELAARVFDPYVRAASGDAVPGYGLGLTVARTLARAMGGDLSLDSRNGQHSRFTLRLPTR